MSRNSHLQSSLNCTIIFCFLKYKLEISTGSKPTGWGEISDDMSKVWLSSIGFLHLCPLILYQKEWFFQILQLRKRSCGGLFLQHHMGMRQCLTMEPFCMPAPALGFCHPLLMEFRCGQQKPLVPPFIQTWQSSGQVKLSLSNPTMVVITHINMSLRKKNSKIEGNEQILLLTLDEKKEAHRKKHKQPLFRN